MGSIMIVDWNLVMLLCACATAEQKSSEFWPPKARPSVTKASDLLKVIRRRIYDEMYWFLRAH